MKCYSLEHLDVLVLDRDFHQRFEHIRSETAMALAYLAEFDARKRFVPAGYSSMFSYCVGRMGFSQDSAYKLIRTARTARLYPVIFPALEDGRLNQSAVVRLTPYLTRVEQPEELLAAAAHRTRAEIELLIAERFPRPDVATQIAAIAPSAVTDQLAPGPVAGIAGQEVCALGAVPPVGALEFQLAPGPVAGNGHQHAPGHVEVAAPRARLTPLSPGRFALQVTVCDEVHGLLENAQMLLGHSLPSGDIAEILLRALRDYVGKLEKRKFGAGSRKRLRRNSASPRHVPPEVRKAVFLRDKGQCTFVSDSGHRCESRERLEYDHIDPVARGGKATVSGMRLLCRAHNQYAAERAFGDEFMRHKREAARAKANSRPAPHPDVIAALRTLGYRPQELRAAASLCEAIAHEPPEQQVRYVVQRFAPNCRHEPAPNRV